MTEPPTILYKDFILSDSGEKIYPQEIEDSYTKAAPVKEMCVFNVSGLYGVRKSKVLWAVVQPDLDEFREYDEVNLHGVIKERFDNAAQAFPESKRLKGFTIALEDLSHTFLGQLNRVAVKRIYEPRIIKGVEGSLPVTEKISMEDSLLISSPIATKIIAGLKEQSHCRRSIKLEDSLELDLGIDSLGRIELASRLSLIFKADLKVEVISKAFRVKALILLITDALKVAEGIPLSAQKISLGADYWEERLNVLPKKETLAMLELGAGYFAWLFRFTITAINFLIFKIFFNIQSEGSENVPKKGAFIIYGNHTSFLDGSAIGASLPRRSNFQLFYFVFGPYFFRPFEASRVLRNFIKMGRFIPFDYSTHFLEALRSCYYVLNHGKGLCFFPEGLRSTTGEIGEFKKGFAVLAKETGAQLVPVAIIGAHEAWPSSAKYPKCYPIRVRFGKPLLPADLEKEGIAMGAQNDYDAICISARKAIVDLKEKA